MLGDADVTAYGGAPTTLAAYCQLIESMGKTTHGDSADEEQCRTVARRLQESMRNTLGNHADLHEAFVDVLKERIPVFFYFDEYSQLPGSVKIVELLAKD
jgi:hypothetical protein